MAKTHTSKRHFVTPDLTFNWDTLHEYFKNLSERSIHSVEELKKWLLDRSELNAVIEEEFAWRYIRMNIDTTDQKFQEDFQYVIEKINPNIAPFENSLNKKLNDCPFKIDLKEDGYSILMKKVETQLSLFRERNIPLFTQLEAKSQKFGSISAKMSIQYKGQEYTLQAATKFLKNIDRKVRKEVFELIQNRRGQEREPLDNLYNELIELRQTVAENAGFENYRDYMFKSMERFDYTAQDCVEFHNSIQNSVVHLNEQMNEFRKKSLNVEALKPWDLSVDIDQKEPLNPFKDGQELLEKTILCFDRIDPFFGDCLKEMRDRKHLDLESKKGKAPGGFNYPLYESGYPFIFMNAVGSFRDVTTMVHEGGHAIHSVLSHSLDLVDFKGLTSEIAELASMSMELISMDHWDVFYPNSEDLKRAKRDQLMDILSTLPWVATIDKFQHWIYTTKNHTVEERNNYWLALNKEFGSSLVDWTGYEKTKEIQWQKQLHLYEVPFYYIEYGMAQLGAIAMWRNYRKNPEKTIQQYKDALSLGYTKSIGEIYETAGVSFNFSQEYVKELSEFIYKEIQNTLND